MWKIEVSSAGVASPLVPFPQSVPSPTKTDVLMVGECFNTGHHRGRHEVG